MGNIIYINRKTGEKETEQVPGDRFMQFLYGGNIFGKFSLWLLIKRKLFSKIGGRYMNSKASQSKIKPFVEKYSVPLDEYHIPKNDFKHFNDFFYRKIKAEARPVLDGVISPADGKILVFNTIDKSSEFFVKGLPFSLEAFLNDKTLANQYDAGAMAIIRLAPVDYHRYHFPLSGKIGENIKIKGDYYSVSPLALRQKTRIFCENKREYAILDTNQYGKVLICDVGATLTGSIIQTYKPNTKIEKGDEKGYFAFGGSTLILLFEKDSIKFDSDLVSNTKNGFETTIKMGETIAQQLNG